ncbi:hypothetical protein BV20DRAFT_307052 [Pilatotrama ljubarskyi]|nr:hypothetical protein BV20DRAFT_307052 [Pilatotrama ljubarskyi]
MSMRGRGHDFERSYSTRSHVPCVYTASSETKREGKYPGNQRQITGARGPDSYAIDRGGDGDGSGGGGKSIVAGAESNEARGTERQRIANERADPFCREGRTRTSDGRKLGRGNREMYRVKEQSHWVVDIYRYGMYMRVRAERRR